MAFESSSTIVATAIVIGLSTYALYLKFTAPLEVPPEIPWVGLKNGPFSTLRARVISMGNLVNMVEEGYRKYSKSGQTYILPNVIKSAIMLPPKDIKWIADQPDSMLSTHESQREQLQTAYTLLDPALAEKPMYPNIIKSTLTKAFDSVIPRVQDEIELSIDEYWGHGTENWTDVGAFDTMMKVVSRASNRIFVGLPLCRNEEYLINAAKFAGDVAISATIIRALPAILKPFVAWIPLLANRWHASKCTKHLIPLVRQRIIDIKKAKEGDESIKIPLDFTTWNINEAENDPNPRELTPERVALRLMATNFAAIHTSTFTATQILFDLYSSPRNNEYVSEIREEITQVLSQNNGKWSKATLAKLVKTDSAIRESLRISVFLSHGMDRLVVSKTGITLPSGVHAPYGSRLGTSSCSVHYDDEVYPSSRTYEAFRFCREDGKAASIVTTSDKFLNFGHGRHACPGRFFAALEMKLLLVYVVMNYDVRVIGKRPDNFVMGGTILPPMKAKIGVKRRV